MMDTEGEISIGKKILFMIHCKFHPDERFGSLWQNFF